MERLTSKGIEKYLTSQYGACRHNPVKMRNACAKTAKYYKVKPSEIFFYITERQDIPSLYCMSYGFQTALGREITEVFQSHYYSN